MSEDVIAWVEQELADARIAAARAFDRRDALAQLRSLVYGFAAERNARTLTPDEMWRSVTTAEQDAELQAVIDRVAPQQEGTT